ncbi:hypothetical protein CLM62_11625 [Streptomyces sp. SA15]|uniref:transaldolase family protein n=1 Tax=Streptomyces sp. SA15 TaxID=934019 RepID=UPI000BAFEBE2|nr:transaldolase family protein [Streptomyces sp. SA15]PAZ15858.1 hypothetical protein CLM62_11625 [Streptomyces sp. SA15]
MSARTALARPTRRGDTTPLSGPELWWDGLHHEDLPTVPQGHRITGVLLGPAPLDRTADHRLHHLTRHGVRDAVHALVLDRLRLGSRLLHEVRRNSGGRLGHLAVEVDPRCAHTPGQMLAAVRTLHRDVATDQLVPVLPATDAGLRAMRDALAEGLNAGIGPLHTTDRAQQALRFCLEGLEQAVDAGHTPPAALVSVGVGAVECAVDALLDRAGGEEAKALRGSVARALAQVIHEQALDTFDSPRWQALRDRGAPLPRLLWCEATAPGVPVAGARPPLAAPGTAVALRSAFALTKDLPSVRWSGAHYGDAHRTLSHLAWFSVPLRTISAALDARWAVTAATRWDRLAAQVTAVLDKGQR